MDTYTWRDSDWEICRRSPAASLGWAVPEIYRNENKHLFSATVLMVRTLYESGRMGLACSSLCLQNVRLSFNGHKIMGFLHVFPTTPVWADCDVNRGSVVLSGDHKDALTCDNTHINLSFNKNKSATEGIQKMRSERRRNKKMCKD